MAGLTRASLSAEAPVAAAAPVETRQKARFSPWHEAWRRFRRHKLAVASAVVLLLIVAAITIGPLLWRLPINEIDFTAKLQGPSWAHPLGTDDLGQDVLARLLYGGRISLAVGLAAMLVAITVGVLVGALAGMSSGRLDAVLMWLADLFLSLPQLPLLLLLIYLFRDALKTAFGPEGGVFVLIVVVIGGLRWMPAARLVRAQFLSIREKEFVEAARALGASDRRIVFMHLVPNTLGPVIVYATLTVPAVMLQEAFLSFLGLGVQPPGASWGTLLDEGRKMMTLFPWLVVFPGLALAGTLFAFNFLGDGLRDALDPQSRPSGV
jgi:peptide/nickel transport system permease protein